MSENINLANAIENASKYMSLTKEAYINNDLDTLVRLHTKNSKKILADGTALEGDGVRLFLEGLITTYNVKFAEINVLSNVLHNDIFIQTSDNVLHLTPKNGGEPIINRSRVQLTFITTDTNETGLVILNEMVQAIPAR